MAMRVQHEEGQSSEAPRLALGDALLLGDSATYSAMIYELAQQLCPEGHAGSERGESPKQELASSSRAA